jgi:CDP-glucose 4,6-dehydratase
MNEFWKGKNVFITGCSGLIGSWLTNDLLQKGAIVTGLIRDNVPNNNFNMLKLKEKINLVPGDIENLDNLRRALSEYNIDTVFHLAAQPIVTVALKDPISTFKSNITGTWNVLEACRLLNTSRIIVASSDKAYGVHDKLPYDEECSLNGRFPYDASKACTDILAQTYFKTYGLPIGITRCGNIYGGGDMNFNRIVPETMKNIIFNKNPPIRSDGQFIREFFYIKDVVRAYLALAENVHKDNVKGQGFNFGSGEPIKIIDLVNKMLEISGKTHLKAEILNEAKAEIPSQYLSAKKAKEILNWEPKYDINEGLKETYEWYQNFFKSAT